MPALTFDDLPEAAKSSVSFDDLPSASSLSFDDLPDASAPSRDGAVSAQTLTPNEVFAAGQQLNALAFGPGSPIGATMMQDEEKVSAFREKRAKQIHSLQALGLGEIVNTTTMRGTPLADTIPSTPLAEMFPKDTQYEGARRLLANVEGLATPQNIAIGTAAAIGAEIGIPAAAIGAGFAGIMGKPLLDEVAPQTYKAIKEHGITLPDLTSPETGGALVDFGFTLGGVALGAKPVMAAGRAAHFTEPQAVLARDAATLREEATGTDHAAVMARQFTHDTAASETTQIAQILKQRAEKAAVESVTSPGVTPPESPGKSPTQPPQLPNEIQAKSLSEVPPPNGPVQLRQESSAAPEVVKPSVEPSLAGQSEGPGAANASEFPPQKRLGGYNADVEASQKARGQVPTMSEAREEDPVAWENAMDEIDKDPLAPEKLVEAIHENPKRPLTVNEQQMLTWRRGDLENRMTMESERAVDFNTSPEERAKAQSNAELLESQLLRTEQANRMAGTTEGRTLRSRQFEMNDDFTFAGIMRRNRREKGEALNPEERAVALKQAEEIKTLNEQVAALTERDAQATAVKERNRFLASTIADLQKTVEGRPKYGQAILDRAEQLVVSLEKRAEVAHTRLRERLGKTSAGIDPTLLLDVADIMAAKIGRLGLSAAEMFRDLTSEFGGAIEPYLQPALEKAHKLISKAGDVKIRDIIKEGVSNPKKGEKTPADIAARAKAEATAGMELSNRTAYEAVRAVINSGVKGELETMNAALDILKPSYPDLTLNDLDVAFSDYGNAKYPSTEATNVQLAKMRRLRQMQAAIEDVKKRGETAKSGAQRAKADEDVRKRQQELADAIDEFGKEVPTTPEQLANRERTRISRAQNAIEDMDRELQTGEERLKKSPPPPGPELEQLQSELAAMRELRQELADAEKPIKPEDQKILEDMEKRRDDLLEKRAAGEQPTHGKRHGPQTSEQANIQAQIDTINSEIADTRREAYERANPPKSEADKQLEQLGKQKAKLDDMLTGKAPLKAAKDWNPLTAAADDMKAENLALQEMLAQLRRDEAAESRPASHPDAKRNAADIKALEKAIDNYDAKIAAVKAGKPLPGKGEKGYNATVDALRKVRDARRAVYDAAVKAGKPVRTPEEIYNETFAKRRDKQIEAAEKRLKDKDFAPRTKKVQPELSKENLKKQIELDEKKAEVRRGIAKYEKERRTKTKKALDFTGDLLQSTRGIMLGSDIGVLTRQGLFSWARPHVAIPTTVQAFKSALSPSKMKQWEINTRDAEFAGKRLAPIRKEAGLQTTDILEHPEELVVTRLLSRIPDFNVGGKTVRLSQVGRTLERFQTTFINDVRARTFDSAVRAGRSPAELKLLANFINSATGRSNITYVPKWMSIIFTSPRYEASRWEMLAQPARNIGALVRDGMAGTLNRAALSNIKDMAVTVAGIYGIFKLAGTAGYSVNWNPASADFLKMRKGDDVWDVSSGLAPRIRDIFRVFVAITHPDYKHNIGKTLLNAAMRTINPAIKTPVDQSSVALQKVRGVTKPILPFTGFKSDDERDGLLTLAPLIVQSVIQALKDGPIAATFTAAREFVGSSVNRYPKPKE